MTWELLCFLLLMKKTPLFVRRLLLWHTMYYAGNECCCVKTWSKWCKYWLRTFTTNRQHCVAYMHGKYTFNILQAGMWAILVVLSVSYVCRDLGVHMKMETKTGSVHLLNIATDTQHHQMYALCVRGSSLNSGYSFRCSLSHLVGSCSELRKVFLNTTAKRDMQLSNNVAIIYILLNIAKDTPHHFMYSLSVRGSSMNSGLCYEQ